MELEAKSLLMDKLKQNLSGELSIEDYPVNIVDYMPSHPKGAILVKAVDRRPIKYLLGDQMQNFMFYGNIQSATYSFLVELQLKASAMKSLDLVQEFTTKILNSITGIDTSPLGSVSDSFLIDLINEAAYDIEKQVWTREIIFLLIATENVRSF